MTKKKNNEKALDNSIIQFPESAELIKNIPLEVTNSVELQSEAMGSEFRVENLLEKRESVFSKEQPIYLQIHAGNIYSIFGTGIITPANYVINRAFSDFQTIVFNGLIVSNGILGDNDESTLLLELNLSVSELEELYIQDELGYFGNPIPVSRVKSIYVTNIDVKKDIITTALTNDGGIIPQNLIKPSLPSGVHKFEFKTPNFELKKTDYSSQLKQYDRIMGSFAFLKNYTFLTSNKNNSISPVPEHYFYLAQAINKSSEFQLFKNDRAVSFYRQLFRLKNEIENPLLKWLFDRVNVERNFTDEDIQEFGLSLFNTSKSHEFIEASKEILIMLSKSLDRKKAINKIAGLQDAEKFYLYLFAFLRTYGNINSENKSISRADIPDFSSLQYGEYVFSLLGYFFGYRTLRNFDEKLNINDKALSSYTKDNQRLPIKFSLDTLFDYVIIESIFCNVFKQSSAVIDTSFLKSDSIKKELIIKPKVPTNNYEFSFNFVFDKFVYLYKKKSVIDELAGKFSTLPNEIPAISEIGVFCFRHGLEKHFADMGDIISNRIKIQSIIFFKKDDILMAVKSNKINAQELIQRIELSFLHKEL